ncbi:MAG TPA: hypothetical protein PLJ93_02665 [Candidatus Mcinerneyibacteriales bacterium]|nr:hypothetical protein [Candidatus Mcinerneyibacteriales bacterium]
MNTGALYAIPYKEGFLAFKVFAVTLTDEASIIHIILYAALFDRPEDVVVTEETPLFMAHLPIREDVLAPLALPVSQGSVFPEEEQIYKNWLTEWNEGAASICAVPLAELLDGLLSSKG